MKKIFLLAIAAFMFTTGMQAQIVRSQSATIEREKTPSNTQWYLRFGVGLAKWVGSDLKDAEMDDYMKAKAGYDLTIGFHKPIGTSTLYWGMEYGLGSRGYKISESDHGYEYTEKIFAHNVKVVPFQIGYKFEIGTTDVAIDPHLGVFLSYDYAGKCKVSEEYDGEKDEDDCSIGDLKYYNKDGDLVDYQRLDAGIQFGVGVWYKNVNLDFTYQRGFVPAWEDAKVYNSQFMIRLGFAF